jgi:CRISPR-associated protein Csm5
MNNTDSITALGCKIPLQILTLSPLHIGGAEVLSPLADYWMDGNKNICLVNNDALAELVSSSGQVNTYVRAVENIAVEKKGKFLQSLVKDNLKGDFNDILTGEKIPSFGIQNPIEIDTCIKTDGLPYIPGSSLKGAIRSAILQDWLGSGKPESQKALSEFIEALMDFSYRNDLKPTKRMDEIEKKFRETMEEKLFGSLRDNNRLAASCLRVTDSDAGTFEDLAMFQLNRFNLFSAKETIPAIKECINTGSKYNVRINIDYLNCPKKSFHPLFKDINNRAEFFELLNRTTLDLLEYEINILEIDGIDIRKLAEYRNFMLNIKDRIKSNGNNKAIIRLGFGKMQFYQTIALGIFKKQGFDENNEEWIQYLSYCEKLSVDISAVYPVTRVLTSVGQRQMGWVELS